MVKLYYTPTSCAASSFICAYIANLNYDCEVVDLATHITESGKNFYDINPKGNVPTLVLDDGTILNENISCLEYIADNSFSCLLAPDKNSNERYVFRQLLSFIATELHPIIGIFFNPKSNNIYINEFVTEIFDNKMKYLQKHILKKDPESFIYGDRFTIIDAYLHVILSWFGYVAIDIRKYPKAEKYLKFIQKLPYTINSKRRMAMIPSKIIS